MFSLKYLFLFVLFFDTNQLFAQTIPAERLTDWSKAGVMDSIPEYHTVINIMDYGAVADGAIPNDAAYANAVAALGNEPGVILFPAGSYMFHHGISMRDSMILQGQGSGSKLIFDLGGAAEDMINIQGTQSATTCKLVQAAEKNDAALYADNTSGLSGGDWIQVYDNDSSIITSAWAYKSAGQILQIAAIAGNKIITTQKLRRSYMLNLAPRIKKLQPVKNAGIECLYIERADSTAQQTANIHLNYAVNCWVTGVESNKTNFAHVEVDNAAHITIRGNYFHHSHGYGGNGQAYGTAVEYASGDCLVENNIFEHLRHAMLVQAGANGNVFAYNYAKDPNWNEPPYPANAAGDIVCHGNYPYLNLFEGNIVQNIVVDNSHGINGPFNTFFRNRAELYGIVQSGSPVTDSMNYIGNEMSGTLPLMGNYIVAGKGLYEWGNNVNEVITPVSTGTLPERSLYLKGRPGYWTANVSYPNIGTPYIFNKGKNIAMLRDSVGNVTDCAKNPRAVTTKVAEVQTVNEVSVYPNPAHGIIYVRSGEDIKTLEISSIDGRTILRATYNAKYIAVDIAKLQAGMYLLRINGYYVQKIVRE